MAQPDLNDPRMVVNPFCKVFTAKGHQVLAYIRPLRPGLPEDDHWYGMASSLALRQGMQPHQPSTLDRVFFATTKFNGEWVEIVVSGVRASMQTGFAFVTQAWAERFVDEVERVSDPDLLGRTVCDWMNQMIEESKPATSANVAYTGRA